MSDPARRPARPAVVLLAGPSGSGKSRLAARLHARTPVYDIATSRAVGEAEVRGRPADLVLAEGIFAAELIGPLRDHGLLRAAYLIHRPRVVTFLLRLARDLRERRKPPGVLVRRGWILMRVEPVVVSRQVATGAVPRSPREVEAELGGPRTVGTLG